MTDLERLFRRLVDNLIAIDPARLHRPVQLGELLSSIIPYRTTRRSLAIDSAEDYDMLVLRLTGGEGGFMRALNHDVAEVLRDQRESPNPDLSVLREHAEAEFVLETEPLAHALGPGPEEAYAPPEDEHPRLDDQAEKLRRGPPPEIALGSLRSSAYDTDSPLAPMVPPPPRITAEPEPSPPPPRRESGPRCGFCGGRLPTGRTVNYCPHCGQNQAFTRCPECQSELELGWKHCINCGHVIMEE